MYIELDETNQFTAYCKDISEVSPEHSKFVIQITDALYTVLRTKMPWKIVTPDFAKIYDTPDITLFIEIISIQPPSLQEQIDANSSVLTALMGV